ncbi:hypothetical protein GJ496_005190 [Pomphorhynchus laevis]|nr:hypothetical protein GJ496_005190 [Pomphorhynchus laevis]
MIITAVLAISIVNIDNYVTNTSIVLGNATIKCQKTNDGYLTWPASKPNLTVEQLCPTEWYGVDSSKRVSRTCFQDGNWSSATYNNCLTTQMRKEFEDAFSDLNPAKQQLIYKVLFITRIIQLCCLCTSALSISIALLIFQKTIVYNPMQVHVHFHLFLAWLIQIFVRIMTLLLQITRQKKFDGMQMGKYINTVCELLIVSQQYCTTVTFMWMLSEGIFLYCALTSIRHVISVWHLFMFAWLLPIPVTLIWLIFTWLKLGSARCWPSYQFIASFWILRAFRLATMLLNFVFITVAFSFSLRQTKKFRKQLNCDKIRKYSQRLQSSKLCEIVFAARKAIFLLPLLGLINSIEEISISSRKLGTWAILSLVIIRHAFVDLQGVLLSVLYCFCNGNVRRDQKTVKALKKEKRREERKDDKIVEDEGWEEVREGATGSIEKPIMFEKDEDVSHEAVMAKVTEILQSRGKRGNNNLTLWHLIIEMEDDKSLLNEAEIDVAEEFPIKRTILNRRYIHSWIPLAILSCLLFPPSGIMALFHSNCLFIIRDAHFIGALYLFHFAGCLHY